MFREIDKVTTPLVSRKRLNTRPSTIAIYVALAAAFAGVVLSKCILHAKEAIESRAHGDLEAIGETVLKFKASRSRYPSSSEFAEFALVQSNPTEPNGEVLTSGTRIGGIIDPFGRPYSYELEKNGRGIILKSIGRDAIPSPDDITWHPAL